MDTHIPTTIVAGTTVQYQRTYGDFPASSWDLKLQLNGPSVLHDHAAQESGNGFTITLDSTQTAALAPGSYQWHELLTRTGSSPADVRVGDSGWLEVKPNPATAGAGAMQPWEEKQIEVLRAALSGSLAASMRSFEIGGRRVEDIPAKEQMDLLAMLEAKVRVRRSPGKLGPVTAVAKFTGAGSEL